MPVRHAARVARTDYNVDFAETGKMWDKFKKKAGQAVSAAKAAGEAAMEKWREQKKPREEEPEEPEDSQKLYSRVDAAWVQF